MNLEQYVQEKEFCNQLNIDATQQVFNFGFMPVDSNPLEEILSKYKQHLIETGELVPTDKWISCADRMPDVQEPVLVYLPKYGTPNMLPMWIEELSGQWFCTAWKFKGLDEVTHWRPLPPAPGHSNVATHPKPITPNGDKTCLECGNENPAWYAPNDVFNEINGSPNGVLCPLCFQKKANELGKNIIFKVVDPNLDDAPPKVSDEEIEAHIEFLYPGWKSDGEWTGKASSARAIAKWMRDKLTGK